MQDTLSEYGHTFQTKVISCLISDKAFLGQVSDLLEPGYFESQYNNWIVEKILDYHRKFKSSPTAEVFKSLLIPVEDKLLRAGIVDNLKESYKLQNSPDLEYVKNEVIEFSKNQRMKQAILTSVDLLKSGKFDQIKKTVDSALKAGSDKDIGHIFKLHIEERYSEGARTCVATNWDVINDIMSGGLANGELGVVVAPAGGGKSWGLINLAANAVKQGKTVIYYTLELNAYYVGRRIDAYLTKIPFQNLGEEHSRERIQEVMEGLEGNLIIKYYPTRTASITTLTSHIQKCIDQGQKPDMIVLDYADLIRPAKASDKRLELNDIYEDLRGVAGEYDIPIWTASQSSRSSTDDEVIEGNKVSESYNKIMIADFVMSLSRKLNDKIGGTGRWHIIKNRFGPDGMTFPSKINTMTGHIEIFEPNSDIGKSVSQSMTGEGMVKKALSQKFKELEGF
jgi:replicative DNA helicase